MFQGELVSRENGEKKTEIERNKATKLKKNNT